MCMQEELKRNAFQKDYLPTQGLPALRDQIAVWYNTIHGSTYTGDNIVVGPGSKELMYLLQFSLTAETILQAPSWVSYANQSTVLDIKTTPVLTTYENKWKYVPESFKGVVNDRDNQLVVINFPGNPTGMNYTDAELKALAQVLDKDNTIVQSDEIYAEMTFDQRLPTISKYLPDKTIVFSAISKMHGAGGWRVGFCIIPDELEEVKKTLLTVASETFSAVAAPI